MDNQFLPIEPKKDTSITTKRQIERGAISRAVYMVTDLFQEDEPLKSALRNAAIDVLKDKDLQYTSLLKSMLLLSKEIGLVSETNCDIITRAILSVEEDDKMSMYGADISSIFTVGLHKVQESVQPKEEVQEISQSRGFEQPVHMATKTHIEHVSVKRPERVVSSVSMASTTLDIGTRRKKILEVVRSKGQATIHEFIDSIQGCSSKTIQRELTSLVLSGTLKKTGERRWSKYSLR